jgi:hypothetical protein
MNSETVKIIGECLFKYTQTGREAVNKLQK